MLAVVGKIRAFDASKLTLKEWIKEIFKQKGNKKKKTWSIKKDERNQ